MKTRQLILAAMIAAIFLTLTGCFEAGASKTDKVQSQATELLVAEAQRQAGMPNIVNFQERKLMKTTLELRDQEGLVCYAYIKSDYNGTLTFIGKCIGYGIPFSAQYTNPEKRIYGSSGGTISLPQPDPNGLFMPTSSSATWLMMVDPATGNPRPVYLEPEIVVSPFPLHSVEG